jgi:hypothetical protein
MFVLTSLMVYVVSGLYILSCVDASVWNSFTEWAELSKPLPEDGDRIQFLKCCALNKIQDDE